MIATLVLVFAAALVVLAAAWVIVGKLPLAAPRAADEDRPGIVAYDSDGRMTADSLARVQFDTAARGYRMDQVDAVLAAVIEQMRSAASTGDSPSVDSAHGGVFAAAVQASPASAQPAGAAPQATAAVGVPASPTTRRNVVDLELSIDIAAPASHVWAAVVDWPSQGEWMLLTDVRVSRGDGRSAGSELSAFTGVGRLGFLDTMIITGWSPPYSCDVLHTGSIVRGTGSMRVRASGDDRSVFIWQESLELPWGWLGRVGWTVGGWLFIIGVKQSLKRFARHAAAKTHFAADN